MLVDERGDERNKRGNGLAAASQFHLKDESGLTDERRTRGHRDGDAVEKEGWRNTTSRRHEAARGR